ncbi:SDR family NAD(P)-dependent oxidoreductase [Actinomadura montaniterrae]|uniref:SDR family NAD(P)-dependent oxidoreductase n=1 Tax=Actinomadura montaniterrae TaxID=1803903 RepID=A0A6L3VN50_9ACTN|nr:SDR family NAD(P)-dependent oxidoreductase [Actinomadura montaniterrae]KAB2375379.1 SDR family NAD(P)-dependent oxidoreductase [Actinomadura montaniterrae]
MEIEGSRVLVTGASSGIGREAARAFAAAGAEVVAVARRAERLAALEAESAGAVSVITADLSEPGAAARVAERAGPVDVLVNGAGSETGGTVWAVGDRDEARRMFEVDWWSPLAMIAALVPGMRERRAGAVVNVTSIRQVLAWPSLGHSAAAKAALAQLTSTLRLELLDTGVSVIEVIPGPVDTPALGASMLLPGFVEVLDGMLGTGTAAELAELIVRAVRDEHERVFYPAVTVEHAYHRPMELRAAITDAVRERGRLPDELADTLVVGPDSPIIADAKAAWEHAR